MGKYRAITLMTAVQITQPPVISPVAKQSQKQEEPKPTYGFRETSGSCPCRGPGWGEQEPELKRLQGLWRWPGRRGPPQDRPLWHKPILRTPSSWRSSRLPSLPGFWPHAPFQARAVQETLNRAYRGWGDSCQLLVFVWLGKPPPFGKSRYCLGL